MTGDRPTPLRVALALCLAAAPLAGQEAAEPDFPSVGPARCPEPPGIRGLVRDAETGLPLPGARVVAADGDVRTVAADRVGGFALCGMSPGPVRLSAEFQGVAAPPETVHVEPHTVLDRDVHVFLGRPGRVEGRVLRGTERVPVAAALVTLEPLGLQMLTDSAGTFAVDAVPPGRYRLAVHHPTGVRIDSLEVRPRSRVRFETRLTARDVVLGARGDGPEGRPAGETLPREEARESAANPGRGVREAASGIAGALLDSGTLRKWGAHRLSQALTLVPGMELVRRCVEGPTTACGFLPRLSSDGECREAPVYIDGRRLPSGPLPALLGRLPLEEFTSVQVLEPGEPLPDEAGGGSAECGAVLLRRATED